ncbi:MAG: CCA tRNA nucleotidyltransferase [Acutalibacteraceae bacterium]|nr:CCA tRNA nucleotidyltransferase [Acutalibacteraceae bacterium]
MKFDLPKSIKFVLDTLIKNGHKAYIVGGCVRDLLCKKEPHDYDITTSATPQQVQSLFEKTVATGIKHGTVTVIVCGGETEVTTFRTEKGYSDNRHPDGVNFVTDVKQDLARRDFTVNAMCYNDNEGLIDIFGGADDIKNKMLKAVGNPETRFCEDALRILRLFRFSATLGFDIEENTFNSAIKCSSKLSDISAERIFAELKKAACGDNVTALCPLLKTNALKKYNLKNADLSNISKLENDENLRVFALLNLTSNNLPETLKKLKCSNIFKDYCLKMNYLSNNIITENKISLKKALNFADVDIINDILCYYAAIQNSDIKKRKELLIETINNKEPYKISHLDISGNDISALGVSGKDIGSTLEFLLDKVITCPTINKKSKLIELICN